MLVDRDNCVAVRSKEKVSHIGGLTLPCPPLNILMGSHTRDRNWAVPYLMSRLCGGELLADKAVPGRVSCDPEPIEVDSLVLCMLIN
jgi:hypothetical protein